VLDVFIIAIMQ